MSIFKRDGRYIVRLYYGCTHDDKYADNQQDIDDLMSAYKSVLKYEKIELIDAISGVVIQKLK